MRRLIASEFVTLDGVMEAPGHEEHSDGKNAWARVRAGTVVPALRWVSLTVRRSPVGIPGSTAVAPGPCLPPG
jgi:hypothetical protein